MSIRVHPCPSVVNRSLYGLLLRSCLALAAAAPAFARADATTDAPRLTLRGAVVDAELMAATPLRAQPAAAPTEADAQIQRALDLLRTGQPAQALAILREVLRKEPRNKVARFTAATALIQAERHREARDILEALLKENPADHSLLNNLAWLYATAQDTALRDPARAVRLSRDALLLAPSDYHVWSTLAEAHFANRDYVKARRAALEALRLGAAQGAGAEQRKAYEEQIAKCDKAVLAFSLVE